MDKTGEERSEQMFRNSERRYREKRFRKRRAAKSRVGLGRLGRVTLLLGFVRRHALTVVWGVYRVYLGGFGGDLGATKSDGDRWLSEVLLKR